MRYEPKREQLRGMSYEKAKLYGMPHIGCKYRRDDIAATAFVDITYGAEYIKFVRAEYRESCEVVD